MSSPSNRAAIEARLRGALWSFFSGDALAAPTHWYYGGFPQIQADYGTNGITDYTQPKTELRGSILNKSDINGGGRRPTTTTSSSSMSDLLFRKKRQTEVSIIGDVINHGKKEYWDKTKSIHYHATLARGENTLEVQLARVLMKTIVANPRGRFNADDFRVAYVRFMTLPGSHNDTYASTCHRMFFANMFFRKLPAEQCPDNDGHNVDTIDGLILPTIAAMAHAARSIPPLSSPSTTSTPQQQQQQLLQEVETVAAQCAAVTRKSSTLERTSKLWSRVVVAAIRSNDDDTVMDQLNQSAQDLRLSRPRPNSDDQMTACYLGQSLPAMFDMIAKYLTKMTKQKRQQQQQRQPGTNNDDNAPNQPSVVWDALISNANVGGENVHRGSILGAILGARAGDSALPSRLVTGLHDRKELEQEIDDFILAVMKE